MSSIAALDIDGTTVLLLSNVALALAALLQLRAFNRSEGRRTQPVVIANLAHPRDQADTFHVYLTNPGVGTAFNVRVGIRLGGVEYPLGPGRGHRWTLTPAEVVPPTAPVATLPLTVPVWPYALGANDDTSIFYARYENAFGNTWETSNPTASTSAFRIRRVRAVRLREWRHRRRRDRVERVATRRIAEDLQLSSGAIARLPRRRRLLRRLGR